MRLFLTAVVCMSLTHLWAADRHVKGYVLDREGLPLPGVTIHDGLNHTSVTDDDGYFELHTPAHVTRLHAHYVGFLSLTHDMERPDDVQILVMTPDTELQEVTVTAGGMGTVRNRLSVLNTESVTSQALTRAACCNLSESFVNNPSVDVTYSDAVSGARQIQLLGLAGTYVQMLTENFPNLRGVAAVYGTDYIPGSWMQSIQVSKGAASVKNGYESITGQINVEYKKPKITDPLLINVFANHDGRYEGNLVGAVELNDRLSTALFANYCNETAQHDENNDTFLDMPLIQSFNLMNRWHYQTDRFVSQSGVKVLSDERTGGQTEHTLRGNESYPPYTISHDNKRIEAFSKNGFILRPDRNESVALIVSGSYHNLQSSYAETDYGVRQTNIYASLLYEREFGTQHQLSAGLNYNWDNYIQQGRVIELYRPQWTHVGEQVGGAYAEYTWTPVEQFTLMAGLRADYSSLYRGFFTPRIHLRYRPATWLDLRASAGKGYRTTFIFPENSYLLAGSRTWHIADSLNREEAWNYGISASLHIPIKERELLINAEWFYTDFQNQVVIDMEQDAHSIYFYNLDGSSTSHVFQIDATYELFRGFSVLGAYRRMDVRCTYGGKVLQKPFTDKYKALLTASYQTRLKKWQFDLTAQFNGGGRMPTPDAEQPLWDDSYPSYTQLSAQITRRFRRWEVYAGGENLTNFRQENPVVAADDPYGSLFDATMVWGPTTGYKIYAGIRYHIPKS